jgi:hypothetical protein
MPLTPPSPRQTRPLLPPEVGPIGGLLMLTLLATLAAGCAKPAPAGTTFGDDLAFLRQFTDVVVLQGEDGRAQVAVVPDYQGRVMTSTAGGEGGLSFGWINRELVASGERLAHINPFGGEDRFWLGPEGGQFSIFFQGGDPFDLDHWQTPAPIDWGAWRLVWQDESSVRLRTRCSLSNYSGTPFELEIERSVRLLDRAAALGELNLGLPASVRLVAFETENRVTNTGSRGWDPRSGLLSIWILGMFNPSPATTVVVPFQGGAGLAPEAVVNDAYFGKVPADRLFVLTDRGVLFFKGDGLYRSKLGINRLHARPLLASWDADHEVLTLVQFTLPDDATDYVNSMWEIQANPYAGDVANSYNDGPASPGAKPLGPFYELESSSPALALAPGASGVHIHRTFHLQGKKSDLDPAVRRLLGISIADIEGAFK